MKGLKGCFGWLLLVASSMFLIAIIVSMCSPSSPPPKLDLKQPVFVNDRALICNELEWYTPGNNKLCGTIGGQRVVVMQVEHEGQMMKVSPYSQAPYFEGAAGWVYYTDLHN